MSHVLLALLFVRVKLSEMKNESLLCVLFAVEHLPRGGKIKNPHCRKTSSLISSM